jgi:hypothetical protein
MSPERLERLAREVHYLHIISLSPAIAKDPEQDKYWEVLTEEFKEPWRQVVRHIAEATFNPTTFQEWYDKHWKFGSATDKHRAQIAWLAAKDFNTVNLQDLEYICTIAMDNFNSLKELSWVERAQKYREKLHELIRDMPG